MFVGNCFRVSRALIFAVAALCVDPILGLTPAAMAQAPASQAPLAYAPATMVFRNGPVYTVNGPAPWVSAVAVRGRDIIYVGDEPGVRALIGPDTQSIDLAGRMLMPGFVEGHIHPLVGATLTQGVDLQFNTKKEILSALRAYQQENRDAKMVQGFGWRYSAFPADGPGKADLDAIWPDTPVVLLAIDAHSAWVNSKALALANVTQDTPDPVPGFSYFKRDKKTGEATGWLVEVPAATQVLHAVAPGDADSVVAAFKAWLPRAAEAGITSVFEAGIQIVPDEVGFQLYSDLAKAGALPFRVVGAHYHNDPAIDPVPLIAKLKQDFQGDLVQASVLKLNMDGVDASRTAAMLAPYADMPSTRGDTLLSKEVLEDIVLRADAQGIDIHVHSIGDRATRMTLDAIERAIKTNPPRDRRNTITHVHALAAEDVARFAKLGVIGQFSAQWAVPDVYWVQVTQARWGHARADATYPFGSLLRQGANISFGTDWPAASNYSTFHPLEALEVAVTRRELGSKEQKPLPPLDERLSLAEAIRANTLTAAYQLRLDDKVGSIEVGKRADLIVLDRNLFTTPADQIHQARVLLTMMDGVVRHRADGLK